MFELSDKLKDLREQKQETDALLKEINKKIDDVEYRLSGLMAESETQNFTRSGTQFYLTTKTHASAVAGIKEKLYAALWEKGQGDLITETLNHATFSSNVKGWMDENGGMLPDWLTGLVNVYEKTTVGIRKSTK
jgi:hypothetical protein